MQIWPKSAEEFARTLAYDTGRVLAAAATHGGMRRPIGWVAEMFWLGIAEELERGGVSRRVAADMLGVSHRTYQRRISTAREQLEVVSVSTWGTIQRFIEGKAVKRSEVIGRFPSLPPRVIGAILHDMVESGWLVEDGEVLTVAKRDGARSAKEIENYVRSVQALTGTLDVDTMAAELAMPPEILRDHVDEMRAGGKIEEITVGTTSSLWNVLTAVGMHTLEYLHHHCGDSPDADHKAGVWGVEVSSLEPEALDELREETGAMFVRCRESFLARAPKKHSSGPPETMYVWSFIRTKAKLVPLSMRRVDGDGTQ